MEIKSVLAREILDSRGNPTVEIELTLSDGSVFLGVSPSGASTGENEAVEKRDGEIRYNGKGVRKAVQLINKKAQPLLVSKSVLDQKKIDYLLCKIDGTVDKHNLGANSTVAISMAVCRAGAYCSGLSLYAYLNKLYSEMIGGVVKMKTPNGFYNVINGGVHSENKLFFQEFMIVPFANRYHLQLQMASEIYHNLKKILVKKFKGKVIAVGDEGGFAPPIVKPEEALTLLNKAVEMAGYTGKVAFAMDVAASEFYFEKKSRGKVSGEYRAHKNFSSGTFVTYYKNLVKKYPIISIEDPFEQNAGLDFAKLLLELKKLESEGVLGYQKILDKKSVSKCKLQVVADDLTCTNPERVKAAVLEKAANCLLLKVNQIGTVTEALGAAVIANKAGWDIMVSHRSGETCDTFIADLAVGIGSGQIKSGAVCRGERIAKYNRLLKIEEELKRRI